MAWQRQVHCSGAAYRDLARSLRRAARRSCRRATRSSIAASMTRACTFWRRYACAPWPAAVSGGVIPASGFFLEAVRHPRPASLPRSLKGLQSLPC